MRVDSDDFDEMLGGSLPNLRACGWCFVCIVLFLFFSLVCGGCSVREYKRQIRELQSRLLTAEERHDTFFVHDSVPVYVERVVEVDRTDYKTLFADRELIKALKLKLSELESENRLLLSTRDTVVLEKVNDSVFTYSDKWCDFSYESGARVLDWEVRDSLSTFVSTEYRHHFLWWRWGKKGYNVTIVNFNPHSRVKYNKFIKLR